MIDFLFNNIFPFLIILTILVFVHELGHYVVARKNGVKVEVFSIGFGKELFGFTDKNNTRWKFSLIPLGGYVKMHGDLDEASTKKDESSEIIPEQSFHYKTISQRSMILFAGPAANFIFSFILLIFININFGISIDKPVISYVEENKPAYTAGLKSGDIILEIDGNKIEKFSEIKRFIKMKNNNSINLLYTRNGKVYDVDVKVVNNLIGVRGTIENKKLNVIESF
jgi:Predicted membrane-associated Zn-dependent proteases 1